MEDQEGSARGAAGSPGVDALCLVAGATLPLAFAPFALWYWAPVPMAVLFASLRGCAWRRAMLRGALFGLGQFGAGIFWIAESFQYNFVPYPVAVAVTAALVLGLALYPACLAALLARIPAPGRGWVLGWPAGWVACEWLRGTLFTGFTWLHLGVGQVDGPLGAWLPLVGTYGTGFIVAALGAALAYAVEGRGWPRLAPLALAVAAAGAGAAAWRSVMWTEPQPERWSVAVVQGNVAQDEKWRPANREPTLRRYLELSRPLWGTDLVVWPETALPGLLEAMRPYLGVVEAEAGARGTELLVGVPRIDPVTGRPLNSMVKLGGADRMSTYDKRHLVPFGEYVPWSGVLAPLLETLGLRLSNFQAGPPGQTPLTVAGRPVGVFICYEVAFAPDVRAALPEAELLVNVSNDAWFGDTIGPHQHLQMARVRARETGRWLVRATNTGISAIIDPWGEVRAAAPQFAATTTRAEVVPHRGRSPYVRLGDAGILGALLLVAAVAGFLSRRP